jgi:hypothetical protein
MCVTAAVRRRCCPDTGKLELAILRDRQGRFEPALIAKYDVARRCLSGRGQREAFNLRRQQRRRYRACRKTTS